MIRAPRWPRYNPTPARTVLLDAALAGCLVAVDVLLHLLAGPPAWPSDWRIAVAASAGCALPIPLVRITPRLAVGLALAGAFTPEWLGYAPLTTVVAFVWLTYFAAATFPLRRATLTATVLWAPVLVRDIARTGQDQASGLSGGYLAVSNILLALVCFLIGRVVSTRRAYTAALKERAHTAEANQRALAEQAVADERRRIARELHDVVAHHVSVTGVLATGARRTLRRDPDAADEALRTIEETSRTALREMRRLLTVLRTEAEPNVELTPQPGLAGIEALVEQIREAGMPVNLRVEGTNQVLDPGVALTVFRIVQEALTNTLKHGGEATADVRLSFGAQWLVVEVSDTGRGPAPESGATGQGLVGMRERVSLYGGTLRTGPRPGGGFRVYAKIPVEAAHSLGESPPKLDSSVDALGARPDRARMVPGATPAGQEGTR